MAMSYVNAIAEAIIEWPGNRGDLERIGPNDAKRLAEFIAERAGDSLVQQARNTERHRIAYLLERDDLSIFDYLESPRDAIALIAHMLRLKANRDAC